MTRKATLAASLIPAAAVTGSQPSSRRSRLTFGPGASRASLSTSADLPAFSHPSSQSNARHFKPLPKPVKEKVEKKNNCNRNKTKREPSWRTRKRLEEEEAERKKREGPLDEAEEGEYDQHGIWQAKQPQSDWDMEARGLGGEAGDALPVQEETSNAGSPGHPRQTKRDYWNGDETDNARELEKLQAMPADHSFDNLFDSSDAEPSSSQARSTSQRPLVGESQASAVEDVGTGRTIELHTDQTESAEIRPSQPKPSRFAHSAPNPSRGIQPLQPRRTVAEPHDTGNAEGIEYDGIHRQSPDIPMPPSAQRQRSISLPAAYQHSRLKYSTITDDDTDEDDEEGLNPTTRASPTELNSSAMQDPVHRSITRRSNSHRQVYSLATQEEGEASPTLSLRLNSSVLRQQPDEVVDSPASREQPTSFPVSQTEVPSQCSERLDRTRTTRLRTAATYSRSRPRVSVASRAERTNLANQSAFRDQFSPEPEWEEEQRRQHRQLERTRSKRHGSTSYWPTSETASEAATDSTVYADDERRMLGRDQEDSDDGEEWGSLLARRPLSEIRLDEQGRTIARGRGRNGAWPEDRDLGLFGDDSQDARRQFTQPLRPVSERLHLIKQEEDEEDEEGGHHRKPVKEKIKAFPDLYHKHPVAKLKLRPDDTHIDDSEGFGRRMNVRDRFDRLPYLPGFNTTGKNGRKRKNELNDLPECVLKPIEKISFADYKKQLKERVPGDGFLNPQLVKSGRLASRDSLLRPQKRIRRSKSGSRDNLWGGQTQIRGDDGEPDPIIPPTQTQRVSSNGTSGLGGVCTRERVRQPTKRITGPRLRFTSTSPRPDVRLGNAQLRFTSRAPPPPRGQPTSSIVRDTYDTSDVMPPRPAEEISGLAQPKVGQGVINRFRHNQSHSPIENGGGDLDQTTEERLEPPAHERSGGKHGFVRKVPGFWAPPTAQQDEWVLRGSPLANHDVLNPTPFSPTTNLPGPALKDGPGEGKQGPTPLFLSHDEVLATSLSQCQTNQASTANLDQPSNRMSGAELCNDLLHRVALKELPILPHAKSSREAKRDEMAKRVAQKTIKGSADARPSLGFTTQAMAGGSSGDDAVEGFAYEPGPSQMRRREQFGLLLASEKAAQGASSQTKSAADASKRQGITQTQATQSRQFSTTRSSAQSTDRGPPGNQQALKKVGPAKSTGKIGRTRSAIAKGFQPPKPVRKADSPSPTLSGRHVPRWATDN